MARLPVVIVVASVILGVLMAWPRLFGLAYP
jgi:hypothetical protein